MEAYAPVALLSQQCFKPHFTSEEGGEKREQGMEGEETPFKNKRAGGCREENQWI